MHEQIIQISKTSTASLFVWLVLSQLLWYESYLGQNPSYLSEPNLYSD